MKAKSVVEKCFTYVAFTGATSMSALHLHVPAPPVVFSRAWRRGLDHVHRLKANPWKTLKKHTMKTHCLNECIEKDELKLLPFYTKTVCTIIQKYTQNDTPKDYKSDPKWFLFDPLEPPWNLHTTKVPNSPQSWPLKVSKREPFGPPWSPWDSTKSNKVD